MAKQNKTSKKKEFEISDELKSIAEKVINNENIGIDNNVKIQYLLVYPNISKKVAGRCMKTNNEFKFNTGIHYIIEMSGELWDKLDDTVKYVLTQHELMHINIETRDNGDIEYNLRDHDVQDFSSIINKHGIDWITKIKLTISSIYDLGPDDERNIKI